MRVLICGGGAIGASLAYCLARAGAEAVVIESSGVANAASGKSGGFLAADWCQGSALDPLARRSFALHAELAEQRQDRKDGDWGYRRVETLQVVAGEGYDAALYRALDSPSWLAEDAAVAMRLGDPATTAQLDPAAFTRGMMTAAEEAGATPMRGEVTGLVASPDGSLVRGVELAGENASNEMLGGDAVVIALGPWSILACAWLPLPACFGLKGHSLVYRYRPPGPAQSLFVTYADAAGAQDDPEVIPRADGTTYVCGQSSETALPLDPAAVAADEGAFEKLETAVRALSPALGAAEVLSRGACYRPVTQDGLPLLGPVPGVEGAFVATGHNVWGMLNAPASGEALAGLILSADSGELDLAAFDPGRLPPANFGR